MSSNPNDPTVDPADRQQRTGGHAGGGPARMPRWSSWRRTVPPPASGSPASVEALVAKTDVKAQAKAKATETADQVKSGAEDVLDQVRQLPPAVLGAVAIGVTLVAILLIRRRRLS